jgi:proteasome accessory factor A
MEWAINAHSDGSKKFHQLNYGELKLVVNSLPPGLQKPRVGTTDTSASSDMLSNGSRYYIDNFQHAEYATPEDISFAGTVANEIAGEKIVLFSLQELLSTRQDIDEARLHKRVVDSTGTTWGYHINLLADRKSTCGDLHLLGIHLATSLPLLGSGAILAHDNRSNSPQFTYRLGQKINDIHHDFHKGTLGSNKALVNKRDEPHTNIEHYRRVHITSMDAHISPWATWLALGSCSLILRAIEQSRAKNFRVTNNQESNPLLAFARQNNKDLTFKKVRAKIGDKVMSQLDIQNSLLDIVRATDHTDEEANVLEAWQDAITDLDKNPKLLIGRSDALTKYYLMLAHAKKYGQDPSDMNREAALTFDLKYDELIRIKQGQDSDQAYQQSIPHKLRQSIFANMHPESTLVQERVLSPPSNTRAATRGALIGTGNVTTADWKTVTVNNNTQFNLDDPYKYRTDLIERLDAQT